VSGNTSDALINIFEVSGNTPDALVNICDVSGTVSDALAAGANLESFLRMRGNIGRIADVCSGCCPRGATQGCGVYKVAAVGRQFERSLKCGIDSKAANAPTHASRREGLGR